jgi:sodium-coupled neutral amino acid transporter 11
VVEPNLVQAIGVMAFAYVCHHNVFLVYESLQDANEKRMAKATHASIGASCALMLVVGVVGYLPFGAATQANVLVSAHCNTL